MLFKSPISNYCLKVVLYDQTEPTLVPKLLLQVSVRELHNSLVSDPNDGGLKDARDEDVKIIISDLHRTKFEEKVTFTKASTRQKLPMTSLVYPIWFHLGGVQNKRPRRSGGHQRWAKTGSGVPSIARMRPPTQVSKTDSEKSKMVTDLY